MHQTGNEYLYEVLKYFIFVVILLLSIGVKSQNPGDNIFNSSLVHTIKITVNAQNYWDSLTYYKAYRDSTDSTIYMRAKLEFDSIVLDTIGVRLKGVGSYSHPGMKKPWKLDFNEFVKGQKLDGLTKLNLQNGTLDPTMIREKLMLDFCRKNGIPAPRCTFAEVYLNDDYIGIYKIIEQVDKRMLKASFGNRKGNLFKGENGKMTWKGDEPLSYANQFQLKNNEDENDWTRLIHLIDVVNNTSDENFKQELESVFNTSAYLRSWATYNLLVSLDSYLYLSHNYYLYQNETTDKFEWVMWDLSLGFGSFIGLTQYRETHFDLLHTPFLPDKYTRPLNRRMLEVPQYKEEYLGYICQYLYSDLNVQLLYTKIDSLTDRIRKSVYKEVDQNKMYTNEEFEGNIEWLTIPGSFRSSIPGLKEFITIRRKDVENQLCKLGYSCVKQQFIGNSDDLIQAYPNPTNSIITVEFFTPDVLATQLEFNIVNSVGQIIDTKKLELTDQEASVTYDTSKFPQGVYYIQLKKQECNRVTGKFVVVH
ncbi:MAG: CotH kinase family protein [Flavobacteriales bacterium]|nr:CotH kinase family protein [Flavobacteriales bacterium]